MSVSAATIMEFPIAASRQTVKAKEAIIYALSVGYGREPLDPAHLRFVYEAGLEAAPTLANVVTHAGPWMKNTGVDWDKLVHAEHRLTINRPIPLDVALISHSRSLSIVDRGPEKGMFATFERTISIEATGEPVASVIQTNACRGDGGCGSAGTPPQPLPAIPARDADNVMQVRIAGDAALLYRLNGDLNPLHIDPAAAEKGGFRRPILHGLCTFGYAGYAISRMAAGSGLADLTAIAARFSAPVFPGETLEFQMWQEDDAIRFRAVAPERGATVLDNGLARVA